MNTFIVKNFTGENAVTLSDGDRLYGEIHPLLKSGNQVVLDFDGVKVFATPFFNAAIGKLLQDLEPELLNKLLALAKINPLGIEVAKRVIKNSKDYYSDSAVKTAVDKVISEQADNT